jgi:hypothetical protein
MSIAELLSGEWMLKGRSNGGVVVFFRAVFIAAEIYVSALVLAWLINPDSGACPSLISTRRRLYETVPWFGATLGAVYAWLYARFSSQWQYLADLYNKIVEAQVRAGVLNENVLDNWRAAFIEDAYTLHLACKPMFAAAINEMLKRQQVREAYLRSTIRGHMHLAELKERFRRKGLDTFS